MENKFRNQLLAESKKKEEELKGVNLEIEERTVSKKGPFVLIRNKNNKWVITTCGALVNGKEFDTKEDAIAQKVQRTGVSFYEITDWEYDERKRLYQPTIRRIATIKNTNIQLSLNL